MSRGYLVDTSVWIEALRRDGNAEAARWLKSALLQENVVLAPPVKAEILSGARSEKQFAEMEQDLDALPLLARDAEVWEKAARLNFNLRRRGINVPLMDILIGSWAVLHDCVLVHRDRHLELVKSVEPALETVIVPGQGLPPELPPREPS